MDPQAKPIAASDLMRRFRSRNTAPEVRLRRELHHRGLRFRLHRAVPGHPRRTIDLVFPKEKLAIFVDGCYWHSCPDHGKIPTTNHAWWSSKLNTNVARDRETDDALKRAGWTVIRVWEHTTEVEAADAICAALETLRKPPHLRDTTD